MTANRTIPASRPGSGRASPRPSSRVRAVVGTVLGATGRFCRKRPGVIAGIVAVLGCGGAVGWNALTQQPGRHPAPLFGKGGAPVEPPRRPDLAAIVAPGPAPLPVRRPETAALAPIAPPAVEAVRPNDPIGAIIRASAETKPEPPRIMAAQKALTRLGYGPLRPDGQMGATTRGALEQFERDQKLPPTGALAPRTLRQLAAMAGTPIE